MPVEFTLDADALKKQLVHFFAGKARGGQVAFDHVDITATKDEVEFLTTGTVSNVSAKVRLKGYARLPYAIFETLFRRPRKLGLKELTVRIEDGAIKAGPTTFKNSSITIRPIRSRIADLPIDAPLGEVLALCSRFTADELADAGLWARVMASQEKATILIDRAAELLTPLEVDRTSLSEFVWDRIKKRGISAASE